MIALSYKPIVKSLPGFKVHTPIGFLVEDLIFILSLLKIINLFNIFDKTDNLDLIILHHGINLPKII